MAEIEEHSPLLVGEGKFTADLDKAGAVFAVFVRSDRAHARIVSVNVASALMMPDIVSVSTAPDLGPFASFPAFLRYKGRNGEALSAPPRFPVASDIVRHVGEIIAVVVAKTQSAALDAAEAIEITYDDLPAIVGLDAALKSGAVAVHASHPDNIAIEVETQGRDGVDAALAGSAYLVTLSLSLPRLAPAPMEPRSALARYDNGRFILHAPHQGAPEVRRDLAAVLGEPETVIDVRAVNVGGAFGSRGPAYPEYAVLLDLARRLGKPVFWQGSRLEAFMTDHHGRGNRLKGTLGIDGKGRFTALDMQYEADLGAYITPVGAHINIHNPLQTLTGCYRIPQAHALFRLAFTHGVPTGPYRGAGRPDMALLIERLVDEAARQTGFDPVALRRRNLVPARAFPYKTASGSVYDSGDYRQLLDKAMTLADWTGRRKRRAAAHRKGLLHGSGIALFVEAAGGGPVPYDEVRLSIGYAQNKPVLVIEALVQSTGQAHGETFRELASQRLGILPSQIVWQPVAQGLAGAGAFGSRGASTISAALVAGCDMLSAKVKDLSHVLSQPHLAYGVEPVIGRAPFAVNFPSGCHIADVLIDPATGVTRLCRFVAVDDAGHMLNPDIVHGQIHGGIVQGFGEVMGEQIIFDQNGQILTGSFMDYAMPRADELVELITQSICIPSPSNPLGVKGAGEAGTTGALAAISNAVIDALSSAGAGMVDIPFTAEKIWSSLRQTEA